MVVRLKTVAKREIVTAQEGIVLGRPRDFLIDPRTHRVAAIVLAAARAEQASIVIPASAAHGFEADTLTIESLDALELAFRNPAMLDLLERGFRMQGRRIISEAGADLGTIAQVLVDAEGRVLEYRVKRGFWGWFGRTHAVAPEVLSTSGGDVAIARDVERPAASDVSGRQDENT